MATVGGAAIAGACGVGTPTIPLPLGQLEQALCHKLLACGCSEDLRAAGYVPPVSCDGWTIGSLAPDLELGDDDLDGTRVDEACIERMAARIDAHTCELSFTTPRCDDDCSPFFGAQLEFQPCQRDAECGRGLACVLGICRDPCQVTPPDEGQPCEGTCALGLVCDLERTGTCIRPADAGPSCNDTMCSIDEFCDRVVPSTPVCRPLRARDEPCRGHRECLAGYCPAGFCEALPRVGEACGLGALCAPGSSCRADADGGLCVAASPACTDLANDVLERLDAHRDYDYGYDYG